MNNPEISLPTITAALSDFLKNNFPDSTVYNNPNQQNTTLPAWFINFMPSSGIGKQVDNRYLRTLYVDLVYLLDYNLTDLYDQYTGAAEILDENLELFTYVNNDDSYLIRTYERKWNMGLADLHYKFKLDIRVSLSEPDNAKMLTIEQLNKDVVERGVD